MEKIKEWLGHAGKTYLAGLSLGLDPFGGFVDIISSERYTKKIGGRTVGTYFIDKYYGGEVPEEKIDASGLFFLYAGGFTTGVANMATIPLFGLPLGQVATGIMDAGYAAINCGKEAFKKRKNANPSI